MAQRKKLATHEVHVYNRRTREWEPAVKRFHSYKDAMNFSMYMKRCQPYMSSGESKIVEVQT